MNKKYGIKVLLVLFFILKMKKIENFKIFLLNSAKFMGLISLYGSWFKKLKKSKVKNFYLHVYCMPCLNLYLVFKMGFGDQFLNDNFWANQFLFSSAF
jgi:hypothetical protein